MRKLAISSLPRSHRAITSKGLVSPSTLTVLLLGLIVLLVLVWLFMMITWLPQDHCSFWTEPPFGIIKPVHSVYGLYAVFAVVWLAQLRGQSWVEGLLQMLLIAGLVITIEGMIAVTAQPDRPLGHWVLERTVPPAGEWEAYLYEEFPQVTTTCGPTPPRRS